VWAERVLWDSKTSNSRWTPNFSISVPDEVLQCVLTVGDFYDAILPLVRAHGAAELRSRADLGQYLWSRVQVLAATHGYDVRPQEITRATRFAEDLGYG
jgi:hypothetical protein